MKDSEPHAYTVEWRRTGSGFTHGARRICATTERDARALGRQLIARDELVSEDEIIVLRVTLQEQ